MKKIAVITDIHGNSPALIAVSQDITSKSVDHIYCLGDVVGIGPDSNEVLELLLSRTDVSFVVGNHDVAVMAAYFGVDAPKGHQNERHHHQWLADRINPEYIRSYFNPGALGCYDKPRARYGIVSIMENSISEELIEVPYDNMEFLYSYNRLQVPEREFILKIFHGGQLI